MFKICRKCKESKELNQFYKHPETKDKLSNWCKSCFIDWSLDWKKKNPLKVRVNNKVYRKKNSKNLKEIVRRSFLKKSYNLSLEEYKILFEKQKGICAICLKAQSPSTRQLAVDHDHKTGQIRGLLCTSCNLLLGNAADSKTVLLSAIKYLEETHVLLVS
jgi:hypothetical protein